MKGWIEGVALRGVCKFRIFNFKDVTKSKGLNMNPNNELEVWYRINIYRATISEVYIVRHTSHKVWFPNTSHSANRISRDICYFTTKEEAKDYLIKALDKDIEDNEKIIRYKKAQKEQVMSLK